MTPTHPFKTRALIIVSLFVALTLVVEGRYVVDDYSPGVNGRVGPAERYPDQYYNYGGSDDPVNYDGELSEKILRKKWASVNYGEGDGVGATDIACPRGYRRHPGTRKCIPIRIYDY